MPAANTVRTALFSRAQPGGMFTIEDVPDHPGSIFFVDSGHAAASDATGGGRSPDQPLATIDYAVGLCTASNGDVIYVMPGHSETLTAVITVDQAGISIIGLGKGNLRPQLTVGGTIDGITVTSDNVLIENLYFNESTAAATSNINVAAAHCTLRNIHMDSGATDVDTITVTAAGEFVTVEGCTVVVTANGPDSWIKFEGVVDRPVVRGNVIIGSDGTNAYDDGVIDFDSVAVTNVAVYDNVFLGGGTATTVLANIGSVVGGTYGGNTYGGSATNADNTSTESELMDALYGTGGIASWPAAAAPANAVSIAEAVRYIVETQLGTLVNTGGTATVGGILGDFANDSLVARLNDIGSNVDGTTTDTIHGKLGTDTELADRSLYDLLNGGGAAAMAAAAAPANDVSLNAMVRAIYNAVAADGAASSITAQTAIGRRITKTQDLTSDPDALFTVTGKVLVTLMTGEVTANVPSACTLQLRVATTNEALCATTTIDNDTAGTMYVVSGQGNAVLNGGLVPTTRIATVNSQQTDTSVLSNALAPFVLGLAGGSLTIEGDLDAAEASGTIAWTLFYIPLEASATVAAAA